MQIMRRLRNWTYRDVTDFLKGAVFRSSERLAAVTNTGGNGAMNDR